MNAPLRVNVRFDSIIGNVTRYYTEKLMTHGATPKGVDWNSFESQNLRFEQLLKVCDPSASFSINDYGCGYGALIEFLSAKGYTFRYCGFDLSAAMIAQARELHCALNHCQFSDDGSHLPMADYTLASGIFNVRVGASDEEWKEYVLYTLKKMAAISEKGFSFNALTKYSDADHMRPDLYYADPLFFFDYCKQYFSKFVALLHDYPLYEFTIIVRK